MRDLEWFEEEVWRDVDGFEGIYKISSKGRLRSLDRVEEFVGARGLDYKRKRKGRFIKTQVSKAGYEQCVISKNGISYYPTIHRLVAEGFIDNELNLPAVNHVDGNKINNKAENLEWVTYQQNTDHAVKSGLMDSHGENNSSAKLTNSNVIKIRKLYKTGEYYYSELAEMFGVSESAIGGAVRGDSFKNVTFAIPVEELEE